MSDFKVKITESEVFPEVKILKPDPWFDYRGEMWTFGKKKMKYCPKDTSGKFLNLLVQEKMY